MANNLYMCGLDENVRLLASDTKIQSYDEVVTKISYQTLKSPSAVIPTIDIFNIFTKDYENIGFGFNQKITATDKILNFGKIDNLDNFTNIFSINNALDKFDFFVDINVNNKKITGGITPTLANEFVIKSYADSLITPQLAALSNLGTFGLIARTASNSFATREIFVGTGLTIANGNSVLGNPTINLNSIPLTTLAGYSASGTNFLRQDGTWAAVNSGTVTNVGISGSSGLTVSGSPITNNGTISLTLGSELQALNGLSITGLVARTGSGAYSGRTIAASTGISITNGNGVAGNPTIGISTVPIGNLNGYPSNSNVFLRGDGLWTTIPSIDINSGTTGQLSISRLTNYPSTASYVLRGDGQWGYPNYVPTSSLSGYTGNSSLFLRGDGQWATPAGGGSSSLSSNPVIVNSDSGTTNFMRRGTTCSSGVSIYGLTGMGFTIDNYNGESAGIGFDGSSDTCTIWTAGDGGTYLNIQDEDDPSNRVAYVASGGAWTVVSSRTKKHSIKIKNNNNVLDRFLKLSVKSYGYKYEMKDFYTEEKKKRIEKKQNKMSMGLVLEELFDVFPNCIPSYYNEMFNEKIDKKLIVNKEIKDITNSGIDYNTLLCYFIMAFQEHVKKTDEVINKLQQGLNE